MITSPPKRGMALVVVLVLLAVMMLVTITLSGRMQQQLGRTRSQQEYQQALWYSASAESLALSALSLSLKNEKRVHLTQPWASGPRFFPLPQGQIAVTLRDAQACFNLNALAQPTTASRQLAVQQLIALISRLDVPAYRAELIAERGENIQVWIDPVVFNDLLNWLNALDEKYALRVTQIDASAAEKTGMVNVQRLEFGRG